MCSEGQSYPAPVEVSSLVQLPEMLLDVWSEKSSGRMKSLVMIEGMTWGLSNLLDHHGCPCPYLCPCGLKGSSVQEARKEEVEIGSGCALQDCYPAWGGHFDGELWERLEQPTLLVRPNQTIFKIGC